MQSDDNPLVNISAPTAAEVCSGYQPDPGVQAVLDDQDTPLQFLDRLLADEKLHHHGVDFLAHALPRRDAIWWASLCTQLADLPPLTPKEEGALQAAVRWLYDSSEDNRRQAEAESKRAGLSTGVGNLAAAVFHSGGSVMPADQPAVEAPPTLSAKGVSSAVHLTALKAKPEQMKNTYRRFLALGIGLALGKHNPPAGK